MDIWDRWPGEDDRAWEWFGRLLELAQASGLRADGTLDRGLLKAMETVLGVSKSTIKRAARPVGRRPSWLARAQAWAIEHAQGQPTVAEGRDLLDRMAETEAARTVGGVVLPSAEPEALLADHALMWSYVRRLALASLLKKIERGEELTAKEAIQYADLATKNERLALGKTTGQVALDLSGMSDKALAELEAAVDRAEKA